MKYYNLLKKLSQFSDHRTHKLSCVIVSKNRIIGKGFNMLSTHPASPHKFSSRHAEFNAFISAKRHIKDAVVYVFRENKNGVPAMARPCQSCYKLLMDQGVRMIVYTFEGSYKEEKLK